MKSKVKVARFKGGVAKSTKNSDPYCANVVRNEATVQEPASPPDGSSSRDGYLTKSLSVCTTRLITSKISSTTLCFSSFAPKRLIFGSVLILTLMTLLITLSSTLPSTFSSFILHDSFFGTFSNITSGLNMNTILPEKRELQTERAGNGKHVVKEESLRGDHSSHNKNNSSGVGAEKDVGTRSGGLGSEKGQPIVMGGGVNHSEKGNENREADSSKNQKKEPQSRPKRAKLRKRRSATEQVENKYNAKEFTEDTMVLEKFRLWESNGSQPAEAVWKGRTFFDPTPHILPTVNLSVYPYLRDHVDSIMPLYPKTLRDYRHTYGNCRGPHRFSTEYSRVYYVGKSTTRDSNNKGGEGDQKSERGGGADGDKDSNGENNDQNGKGVTPLSERGEIREATTDGVSMIGPDDNPDTFTRLWPHIPDRRLQFPTEHERCHAVMIRQLAILTSVLEHYNLTNWFISHATLLGAVRHGGMIPWDVDVDVVMTRSTSRQLRRIWRREFPRDMFLQSERTDPSFKLFIGDDRGARIKDRYSGFHGFEFTHFHAKSKKKKRISRYQFGAGVDIIPINRVPLKNVPNGRDRMKVFHSYFNASDVFPTSKICFENFEVRAPKDPIWFLDLIYGKGKWRELPEHPILAAPTALPCISTTPLWGSVWNLKWERDHPLASNKSVINREYEPFVSSDTEEEDEAAEAAARRINNAKQEEKSNSLTQQETASSLIKALHNGEEREVTDDALEQIPALEKGDIEAEGPSKAKGTALGISVDAAKETASKGSVNNGKPPAFFPLAGAKLFPRSDPHGTHRDDVQKPYMKYLKGAARYGIVQNKDEASDH